MRSWKEADEYLGRKVDRPLPGRATRLIRLDNGDIAVRYQRTAVVTYHKDRTITLDSGGWQTYTTKARINEYTRAMLWQQKGIWYVTYKGEPSAFYDGMKINEQGTPLDPKEIKSVEDIKRKLDRAVSKYIKGFEQHIIVHGLQDPSGGDCWSCYFALRQVTQDGKDLDVAHNLHIQPLGIDHLLLHMRDKYYVPSLLWRAIVSRGYRDPALIWHMIKHDAQTAVKGAQLWQVRTALNHYFRTAKPDLVKWIEKHGWPEEEE